MVFPPVAASNLDNKPYILPEDFESPYNVVVLAFAWEQQRDVESWMPFLSQLKQDYAISVYELPTLTDGTWAGQHRVDGNPDPATTIALHLDVTTFIRVLKLPDTSRIYTLVVDRTGRVHCRADGAYDIQKGQVLTQALHAIHSTTLS